MKIQLTNKPEEVLYNNILIIDLFTFSTTASFLLSKNPKSLYSLWWEAKKSFLLQEKLNKNSKEYLLVDDSIQKLDEKNLRINWHPIPIFYKNKVWWKNYSNYNILYRSQNWTQAIAKNYFKGRNILIWSFVNFDSTLNYIKKNFTEITLFVCGSKWEINSDDLVCAKYYEYFLNWNLDDDKSYYKFLIREMINSNNSWDFFVKYMDTIYWDLLWFNLCLNKVPWVIKATEVEIQGSKLYKLILV
jgi:hypothetical protein